LEDKPGKAIINPLSDEGQKLRMKGGQAGMKRSASGHGFSRAAKAKSNERLETLRRTTKMLYSV
jgi:hypothetical protein